MRKLKIGDKIRVVHKHNSNWMVYEKKRDGMFCIDSYTKIGIDIEWIVIDGNIETIEGMLLDIDDTWSLKLEIDKWDKLVARMTAGHANTKNVAV